MSSALLDKKPSFETSKFRTPNHAVNRKEVAAPNFERSHNPRNDFTQSLLDRHLNKEPAEKTTRPIVEEKSPALESRNVTINGKRTSIRLEPSMWDALEEICVRERRNMHKVCTHIHNVLSCSSFTAAVRVYTLSYFRAAATEMGHSSAGHGPLTREPKFIRRY